MKECFMLKSKFFVNSPLLSIMLMSTIIFASCSNGATASSEKAITSFAIGDAEGVISGQAITITLPYGTDLTALTPVIEFVGTAVDPASGTPQGFTGPVTYRVLAEDGSSLDYTVTAQITEGHPIITIAFTPLVSETVDLTIDSANDLSRLNNDTLRISVDGESPVRWFVNTEEQTETGLALTIAATDYPEGIHHVAVLVYKDGAPYSDEVTFKVVK
jgi:hypothetical protein